MSSDPEISDRDLLAAIGAGNAHALRVLSEHYGPVLTAVALQALNDATAAEEVASDTLWQAWSDAKSYDPRRGSVGAWLIMLARERAASRLKRTRALQPNGQAAPYVYGTAKSPSDHEQLANLLPLAAVKRIELNDSRQLHEHLRRGCDECRDGLQGWRHTAAALAQSSQVQSKLWQRLDARLYSEAAAAHSLAQAVSRPPRTIRIDTQFALRWWRGVASAAIAAVIVLSIYNHMTGSHAQRAEVRQLSQLESLSWQLNNLRAEVTASQMEVESLRAESDQQARFGRLLMAPDVQLTRLADAGPAHGASALIVSSNASHLAMLQALGLPQTPPGRNYELWWITGRNGPVKAGLFFAQAGRPAIVSVTLPPAGQRLMFAAVTLEAAGGAAKPKGPAYLRGAPDRE